MPRIFFVGGTGHIGGAVLDLILPTHPEVDARVLVRTTEVGQQLSSRYSTATPVIGDLSNFDVIEAESKEADITINTAPDLGHDDAIKAVIRGLKAKRKKGFYIQTSGSAVVWGEPDASKPGERVWSDLKDIEEILSRPDTKTHAIQDKLIREAADFANIAIVSPSWVTGLGPSAQHPYPLTVPLLVGAFKTLGSPFIVSAGQNLVSFIHVKDIAAIYGNLVNDALDHLKDGRDTTNTKLWGREAYYFGASETIPYVDFISSFASVLESHGAVSSPEVRSIDMDLASKATAGDISGSVEPQFWASKVAEMYAVDMNVVADRARERLSWVPKEKEARESFAEAIDAYLKAQAEK